MSVFFVHDVGKGLVTPLDRKFRVRDIPPTDELSEIQKVRDKLESDPDDFKLDQKHQDPSDQQEDDARQQEQSRQQEEARQQVAQAYQTNARQDTSLGRVKDIMSTPVLSIAKDKQLSDAWRVMQKYEIHHLVILDAKQNYCGMLSEKRITPFLMQQVTNDNAILSDPQLEVFCGEALLSTHPDTLISELAPALLEYGLDAIAVFSNQNIVGIVTTSDILKLILKQQRLSASA